MKTTVEIADELFHSAKERARQEGSTLRALIEEGLRTVLERRGEATSFRLRDASFAGDGVQPEIDEGDWATITRMVYEGRGA